MKIITESQKLHMFKITTLFLFIIVDITSSQNTTCPFKYFYKFGDGVTDIGNSIRILPTGPTLPATRPPYGVTFPGTPTGRWSDGRIDADYVASGVGLQNITPYLALNLSSRYNANVVVFAVARSPVLDRIFFIQRGITIPSYATPLSRQFHWFKTYLTSVSTNQTERAKRIAKSIISFGDIEANDIGYALVQGKSIQQVRSYVPSITQAQISGARAMIKMGVTRIVIYASAPLGCYPYILTALPSTNSSAYDELGCLKSVNDVIIYKNDNLQQAVHNLNIEYPDVTIAYVDKYEAILSVINQTIASGGRDIALRSCCGIGGRYNYDNRRFCGSQDVSVCPNPSEYVYWDGLHFTQETYRRVVDILIRPALPAFNCTSQ